jgi:exodeoxyribonuclease V alpha subunit
MRDSGYFSEIDRHFAGLMVKLAKADDKALWLAAALASQHTQAGHVCLDLAAVAGKITEGDDGLNFSCPELQPWLRSLRESAVVGAPGDFKPLILDAANRLYLYRYWEYENSLAKLLKSRSCAGWVPVEATALKPTLARLFPEAEPDEFNWQAIAAAVAAFRRLCIISGGPGTGKTTTVVKILALLIEQAAGKEISIALAAPTGKAAARLRDAVKRSKPGLACPTEVLAQIPEEASTLHRLLGSIPGSVQFRYHRSNLLPHDVVVVDEASMIDLPLMAKLVQAIRQDARLILLGDKDQLASVEPGAVFGDLCAAAAAAGFSGAFCQKLEDTVGVKLPLPANPPDRGLPDSLIVLEKNYRFSKTSGLGRLSRSVHSGDWETLSKLLESLGTPSIFWKPLQSPAELAQYLETWVLDAYAKFLRAEEPSECFRLFESSRILCVLRKGPFGVMAVNQMVEDVLTRAGLIRGRGRWYRGRPIIINHNDYPLRLFNGDVGLALEDREGKLESQMNLRVFFPTEEGTFRKILPMKLPEHETVYATTVHKAQGSEFDRVLLVLPDRSTELLTRELIYTGITRARRRVEILGNLQIIQESISKRIERRSGLGDALAVAGQPA